MARHSGDSKFHDGAPTHRSRKQRKRRGNRKESLKARTVKPRR